MKNSRNKLTEEIAKEIDKEVLEGLKLLIPECNLMADEERRRGRKIDIAFYDKTWAEDEEHWKIYYERLISAINAANAEEDFYILGIKKEK